MLVTSLAIMLASCLLNLLAITHTTALDFEIIVT